MSHPCQRPNAGGQLEHALNLDHLHCNALVSKSKSFYPTSMLATALSNECLAAAQGFLGGE